MAEHLIRQRVINSTRDAIKSQDPVYKGQVASGGMVAMAILELTKAVNQYNEIITPRPELEPWWKIRLRYRRDQVLNKLTAKL